LISTGLESREGVALVIGPSVERARNEGGWGVCLQVSSGIETKQDSAKTFFHRLQNTFTS
jgi:hypothetical protein